MLPGTVVTVCGCKASPLSLSVSEVYTSGCPGNARGSYWKSVSAAVSTFMVLNTNIKVLHAKCFVVVLLVTLLFLK